MGLRRGIVAGVMALVPVVAVPPARAVTPIDPGDFTVTMDNPGAGADQTRPTTTCTVSNQTMSLQSYVDNVVATWNQQGASPPTANCVMSRTSTLTNAALTGTVVNKTVGQGSMTQTCDMNQRVDISFTLAATVSSSGRSVTASTFANAMTGFQACAWAMTFGDARSSRLTGTIEQTFGFSGGGAPVECPSTFSQMASQGTLYCLVVTSTSKVYVVGGAGEFASTGGEGQFTTSDIAPVVIPKTGSVQGASARDVSRGIAVVPGVDSASTANGLKLALLAGARPSVRLVSPPSTGSGRSLGLGPNGATQMSVKFATAPGSRCSVTGKTGAKLKTLLPPLADADGVIASSITAAVVKAKLGVKSGAKVTLGVSCAVGKTTVKSSQSVTVGA